MLAYSMSNPTHQKSRKIFKRKTLELKMHNKFFELYDIDSNKPMKKFEEYYDLAAYRTLVTVCDFLERIVSA